MRGDPSAAVSVVIVHHRVPEVLAEALERLRRHAPRAEIVLVDTAPDEAVVARASAALPHLTIVRAPNHSYAYAVDLGLKRARRRLALLMNADVYLQAGVVERLVAALEAHPRAAAAAPLARTVAGRREDHGPLYHVHYLRLALKPGGSVRVPWLPGSLMLVRRAALAQVGGLDASLRFYNEDVDLCLRLRAAGHDCRLVDVPVLHLGGASTPTSPDFLVEGVRGAYQLSRRYLPVPLRRAHRIMLIAWGTAAARLSATP
ncbi:MAG: glycosyltransferase family 2 protein, partial [Deinococcales bacterium]